MKARKYSDGTMAAIEGDATFAESDDGEDVELTSMEPMTGPEDTSEPVVKATRKERKAIRGRPRNKTNRRVKK